MSLNGKKIFHWLKMLNVLFFISLTTSCQYIPEIIKGLERVEMVELAQMRVEQQMPLHQKAH